ncbi:hypothetical protein ACP4OV_005098 [Aristida adscensionis]
MNDLLPLRKRSPNQIDKMLEANYDPNGATSSSDSSDSLGSFLRRRGDTSFPNPLPQSPPHHQLINQIDLEVILANEAEAFGLVILDETSQDQFARSLACPFYAQLNPFKSNFLQFLDQLSLHSASQVFPVPFPAPIVGVVSPLPWCSQPLKSGKGVQLKHKRRLISSVLQVDLLPPRNAHVVQTSILTWA